jgi:hypothetical protein
MTSSKSKAKVKKAILDKVEFLLVLCLPVKCGTFVGGRCVAGICPKFAYLGRIMFKKLTFVLNSDRVWQSKYINACTLTSE